jgi:hypothetical protein
MSLEIDYSQYKLHKDKGISIVSQEQLYLLLEGHLFIVRPTQAEHEQEKEEIDSIPGSF